MNDQHIKVALVQRICPHYRVPVFRELAQRKGIDLTVFFGKGTKRGPCRNAEDIQGFKHKKLWTLPFTARRGLKNHYLAFHPSLLFHLVKGHYDVVITEGGQNILNNIVYLFFFRKVLRSRFVWWDAGLKKNTGEGLIEKLVLFLFKRMMQNCDAFIAYSSWARDFFLSLGVPEERIFIAQNTIDERIAKRYIDKYRQKVDEAREKLGLQGKRVILTVGSIEKRKKVENLLLAFKEIASQDDQVVLYVVGDGPHRPQLERFAQELGLSSVAFPGRVGEDISLYFLLSDVFVLPAHGGLAINEAMIHGKPVIATFADGTERDLISDAENGFLVKEDDISELAEAIKKVIYDADLAERMGLSSAARYEKHFTIEKMVDGIVNAIRFTV